MLSLSLQTYTASTLACGLVRIFSIFIALPSYVHFLEADFYDSDFFMINMPEIAVFLWKKIVKMLSLGTRLLSSEDVQIEIKDYL